MCYTHVLVLWLLNFSLTKFKIMVNLSLFFKTAHIYTVTSTVPTFVLPSPHNQGDENIGFGSAVTLLTAAMGETLY